MTTLEGYLNSFENYLLKNPFEGEPASLYEAANYIMQLGGKRIRPAMVLMACDAFHNSFEEALPVALAVEVLHNFTLVHDDIMDAAPLRRGKPTVHKKWDEPSAILCGDMMMFKSIMLLQQLPNDKLQDALSMFNKTAIEVCEGQQLDMLFETRSHVSIPEYLQMISLKTSVLLGCSFYLGAIIGGAKAEDAKALYSFGKNLGIAFQLHDDILDAFAEDATAFGKQIGGDILANKKTYLLITALQKCTAEQLENLKFMMEDKDFPAHEKVEAVKEIFLLTGAKQAAESERQHYFTQAIADLKKVNISRNLRKI